MSFHKGKALPLLHFWTLQVSIQHPELLWDTLEIDFFSLILIFPLCFVSPDTQTLRLLFVSGLSRKWLSQLMVLLNRDTLRLNEKRIPLASLGPQLSLNNRLCLSLLDIYGLNTSLFQVFLKPGNQEWSYKCATDVSLSHVHHSCVPCL